MRDLKAKEFLTLESHKARAVKQTAKAAEKQNSKNKSEDKAGKGSDKKGGKSTEQDESKFADYFKYSIPVRYIKPHQVKYLCFLAYVMEGGGGDLLF